MRTTIQAWAVMMVLLTAGPLAQDGTPADLAAKISGTWKLNVELSPAIAAPGRRGGGMRGGGPSFAIAAPLQRGGGGGRGGGRESGGDGFDVPPEELAAQHVLQAFQQVPTVVTIEASPASVHFQDPSGQGTFAIDGKNIEMNVDGAKIKVKTKWEKASLRQEFASSRRKVIRSWGLDPAGHLVLTMRVESMMMAPGESHAVFDRQP